MQPYLKWILIILAVPAVLFVVALTHYTLPGRDIVRLVGTDVKRMDVGQSSWFWASPDAGTNQTWTRDVRFINAVWPDGSPRVYRNEDTNWNWPPYFKFDSGNITAEAQALAQQKDQWVAVTHYGWRIELFSIFPNVVKIKRLKGPDTLLIPWFNILFFCVLGFILTMIYLMVKRFKERNIDPVLEDIDEMTDNISDNMSEHADAARDKVVAARSGFQAFMKRWFGEAKK